jgi:quinohemoprotein ethanol dehydrogenase
VGALGLAWSVDLGTNRVLEATPVVIGGVMYTSGVAGRAYAFDAVTGRELWRFEPQVDMQVNRAVCCDMANRGVAVARGKVFVSALDGWMYALDARERPGRLEERRRSRSQSRLFFHRRAGSGR